MTIDINAARKARTANMWVSIKVNDRPPFRFKASIAADHRTWLTTHGIDPEGEGIESFYALIHPDDVDQFRKDCADDSPEYGIDVATINALQQELQVVWGGRRPLEPSSPSSATSSSIALD